LVIGDDEQDVRLGCFCTTLIDYFFHDLASGPRSAPIRSDPGWPQWANLSNVQITFHGVTG
jgi:hypothetical protein